VRTTNTQKIEVISLCIPSKSGGFSQEYYPAFNANEPSSTAEAWCAGTDVPAKTMQLTAAKKVATAKKGGLNRLKGGAASAAPEESKGSDDSAGLKA